MTTLATDQYETELATGLDKAAGIWNAMWTETAETLPDYIDQIEYVKHRGALKFAADKWTRDLENNPTETNRRRAVYALNVLAVMVYIDTGNEQEYRRLCDRALDLACSGTAERNRTNHD